MAAPDLPTVSIIMPVHNAAAFLAEAIASVQAQTMTNWELLAVDDGSTDGSAAILAEMAAKDARIHPLTTGANKGAGHARNHAMDVARGKWLAFLDADDLWLPQKLAVQLQAMAQADVPFSCTAYLRRDLASGRETPIGVPPTAKRSTLLKTNTVACSTAMVRRDVIGARRMPNLRRRQDFLFWLDILTATPKVLGLPQPLTIYRQHRASLSAPKSRAAADTWVMYRRGLGLPLVPALWNFAHYALRGLLRHRFPALARKLGVLHRVAANCGGAPPLTIAIATTASRVVAINFAGLPTDQRLAYQIFVQGASDLPATPRPDIRFIRSAGLGAARNRNAALETVTSPLLLFGDDDLSFNLPGLLGIIDRFTTEPGLDFICARLSDETGLPRKAYSPGETPVRWWNCAKVGTPEIALRLDRFRGKGLRFDTRFGAGSADFLGDEYIFLCDALRHGLKGRHVDLVLARHPKESSGTREDPASMAIRKRMFIRALGPWQSLPARALFAAKHRRRFREFKEIWRFLQIK